MFLSPHKLVGYILMMKNNYYVRGGGGVLLVDQFSLSPVPRLPSWERKTSSFFVPRRGKPGDEASSVSFSDVLDVIITLF